MAIKPPKNLTIKVQKINYQRRHLGDSEWKNSINIKLLWRHERDTLVEELIYLGDHIRTRVNVCGHNDFIVKVPNISDHASLIEGHPVKVGWTIDDCRALDVYEGA